MLIHPPLCITSRLLPGIRIGDREISIEYSPRPGREGRTRYRYHIGDHTGDDLQSGCQGGSLQEGLESLLSFLGSPSDSDGDLFPPESVEWAGQNSDEIGMAQIELSETPDLIEE